MKLTAKAYLRIAAEDWRKKYDWVWPFREGLAKVRLNPGGKYGFVNEEGKLVIPVIYDFARAFSEGFAAVKRNREWGFVDKTGKEVIPCVYDEEELPKREAIPALSLQIREKYERDPEGLELVCPEFDWKAWYEQVTK